MAKLSKDEASSSSMSKKQQAKRKQSAPGSENTKKQRHTNGAAAVVPYQSAASNSVAMALPMATPGAAANSNAALVVPTAGINGSNVASIVLAYVPGQPVPVPVQLVSFVPMPMVAAVHGAPAAGMPLAAALARFPSHILARMLTALMHVCTPPLRAQDKKSGAPPPPPWWPTGEEPWWGPDVAAQLAGRAMGIPVPFTTLNLLKKAEKVAVLVAAVKNIAPDFNRIAAAASRFRLSEYEACLWNGALHGERAKYATPTTFILQQQCNGGHPLPALSAASGVHAGVAATGAPSADDDGCEQRVTFSGGIHGSHDTAAVTAPTDGSDQLVVTTKPDQEQLEKQDAEKPANHSGEGGSGGGAAATEPEDMPVPVQVQHGDEGPRHQTVDRSGDQSVVERASAAAPEETMVAGDLDGFDYDEMRRRLDELEIPDLSFGGYYF